MMFYTFAMVAMNFLRPIFPSCQATDTTSILMVVYYLSQFIWDRPYANAEQEVARIYSTNKFHRS